MEKALRNRRITIVRHISVSQTTAQVSYLTTIPREARGWQHVWENLPTSIYPYLGAQMGGISGIRLYADRFEPSPGSLRPKLKQYKQARLPAKGDLPIVFKILLRN